MQREIKFRAYSPGNGWITGFNMVGFSNFHPKDLLEPHIYRYSTEWKLSEIILEQYSGLQDQDGLEIYEGDIVEFPEYYETPEMTNTNYLHMPVVFLHGAFHIKGKEEITVDTYNLAHEMECYDGRFKVIGNIHQNPELLTTD